MAKTKVIMEEDGDFDRDKFVRYHKKSFSLHIF